MTWVLWVILGVLATVLVVAIVLLVFAVNALFFFAELGATVTSVFLDTSDVTERRK